MVSSENGAIFEFQSNNKSERIQQLFEKMKAWMEIIPTYNPQKIKKQALQRYSETAVAELFKMAYSKV